jgi:hypothetical protein
MGRAREWTAEDYRANAWAEKDPELLGPQDLIRYAEQLIRREHGLADAGWDFWRYLANELNWLAGIPDRTAARQDWSEFNRAHAIAVGYLRMSPASQELRAELLRSYTPKGVPGGC